MSINKPAQSAPDKPHRYEMGFNFEKGHFEAYDMQTKVKTPLMTFNLAICNFNLAKFSGGAYLRENVYSNLVDQQQPHIIEIKKRTLATNQVETIYKGRMNAEARETAKRHNGAVNVCWAGLMTATMLVDGKAVSFCVGEPTLLVIKGNQFKAKEALLKGNGQLDSEYKLEKLFAEGKFPILKSGAQQSVPYLCTVGKKNGFLFSGKVVPGESKEVFEKLKTLCYAFDNYSTVSEEATEEKSYMEEEVHTPNPHVERNDDDLPF